MTEKLAFYGTFESFLDFWTLHCSQMQKNVETVLKISLCSEEEIPTAAKSHKAKNNKSF